MQAESRPALTLNEFTKKYGVNPSTVYRWAKAGEIRLTNLGGKSGKSTRILPADEDAWLANRPLVGRAA